MAAKNDVTGDKIKSKHPNEKYREGWDKIFGNDNKDDFSMEGYENLIDDYDVSDIEEEQKKSFSEFDW